MSTSAARLLTPGNLARETYRRLPPLNSEPAPVTKVESTDLRAA